MAPLLTVFDLYGTLLNLNAGIIPLRGEIGPATDRLTEIWRRKQEEYTWVRALMGRHDTSVDPTEAALDVAAARCGGLEPDLRRKLLDVGRTTDAYPDARPTLSRLRREGGRTAVLSETDPAALTGALAAAGLGFLLDATLSCEPLRTARPDPRTYALVGEAFAVEVAKVTYVSAHRWDVAGAAAFGFATVWLNRAGLPDEYPDLPPGRVIGGLDELFGPIEKRGRDGPE